MHRPFVATAVAIVALAVATPASATIIAMTASLDCSQANAGAGTCGPGSGTGGATITFDDSTNTLSWVVNWSGLSGPATLAHFHGPAFPHQNAGVQVSIGTTLPAVGAAVLSASQASDLLNELWYINVHTASFPGGEIRGQVLLVPEPTSLILAGAAVALLALRRRL